MSIKLGIAGGGQLARMMLPSCLDWDIDVKVLDKEGSVASSFCQNFVCGDFQNPEDILKNFSDRDVVTLDLEAVSVEGLQKLENQGIRVSPSSSVLSIIQNKIKQKEFFVENGLPTSKFLVLNQLESHTPNGFLKLPTGGYDGKGVVKWGGDLSTIPNVFQKNVLWEEVVEVEKEISVVGVRGVSGEILLYEPTEMIFDHELNLISHTLFPSTLSLQEGEAAKNIAFKVFEKLAPVGVMAVELFLTKSGEILVNELAPRPHNSGHHTIESCRTSQFENHIRAVLGLSLGPCSGLGYSSTFNLIGSGEGQAHWIGVDKILSMSQVYLHNYGKKECRSGRKMGHVTIVSSSREELSEKLKAVKSLIKVEGKSNG